MRDELWGKDGSHPSKDGNYLAACVFYAFMFEESPRGADFVGGIEKETAQELQRAAGRQVQDK